MKTSIGTIILSFSQRYEDITSAANRMAWLCTYQQVTSLYFNADSLLKLNASDE